MKANSFAHGIAPEMPRAGLAPSRKIALAGGILYLITFVSVPQFLLYTRVRDPNYLVGPGPVNIG